MRFEKRAHPRTYRLTFAPALSVVLVILSLNSCTLETGSQVEAASTAVAAPGAETAGPETVGEVPAELFNSILDDLIAREDLRREDIEIERAEFVIWSDGALGCPKPGEIYTHAQVPGYWVVFKAGDKQYDYRASGKGFFRRCGSSHKVQLPVG